jgi:hypothetical protein
MATQSKGNRPVHEVRLGRIRAAIWENQSDNGLWHNVAISRSYRDGEEWKSTSKFNRDDLPLVAKVSDLAHSWIYGIGQESAQRDDPQF